MATAQLADLSTRFESVATLSKEEATGLAKYLDAGGLVQLTQGLGAELEKKGAPPIAPPGSLHRYMRFTLRKRFGDEAIERYLNNEFGELTTLHFYDTTTQFWGDSHELGNLMKGAGYAAKTLADDLSDEDETPNYEPLQRAIDTTRYVGLAIDSVITPFLYGVLHSIVDTPMEHKMQAEIKTRLGFLPDLTKVQVPEKVLTQMASLWANSTTGFSILTVTLHTLAGLGYSADDVRRFNGTDWEYVVTKATQVKAALEDATAFEGALMA